MNRKCSICGKVASEYRMFKSSPSPTHTTWRCWECYKKGHGEVTGLETRTIKRRIKEMNRK